MAFEWVSGAWSFLQKASAPLAVAVAVVSGAVIWVPPVKTLLKPEWASHAGLVFLGAAVVALAHLFEWLRSRVRAASSTRSRVALLRDLPPQAKAVLGVLVAQEEVLRLDCREGPVSLLHAAGILFQSSVSHGGFKFDFTLQPWARAALKKDPTLLNGAAPQLEVSVYSRELPSWERGSAD
jgi:hypothetical protein